MSSQSSVDLLTALFPRSELMSRGRTDNLWRLAGQSLVVRSHKATLDLATVSRKQKVKLMRQPIESDIYENHETRQTKLGLTSS